MGFFKKTHGNIKAVMERDPAARHSLEVILCYPGVWALIFHSLSHTLYKINLKLLARMVSQLGRWFTGIEIHPGTGQRGQRRGAICRQPPAFRAAGNIEDRKSVV